MVRGPSFSRAHAAQAVLDLQEQAQQIVRGKIGAQLGGGVEVRPLPRGPPTGAVS